MNRIDAVQPAPCRRDLPPFRAGDTVRVHVNITEGDKQRIQIFEGVVIRRRGHGASASFTVRKVSYGVGVERVFMIESPESSGALLTGCPQEPNWTISPDFLTA